MDRSTTNLPTNASEMGTSEENDRLQARSLAMQAEWVSAISYWCDYLTIIDVQGLDDPALRRAS
jgi:hypothetical protein